MIVQAINDLIDKVNILSVKTYFPQSHSLLTDDNYLHKTLFGQKISSLTEENKYYNSRIKNLNLEVFEVKNKVPNAYTIPGISSLSILKQDPFRYYSLGLEVLAKHPLSANLDNKSNKIVFNSEINNFRILVFINSGLIKRVPNIEDRFAIILHEIGHWIYIHNIASNVIFNQLLSLVRLGFAASFIGNYFINTNTSQLTTLLLFILRTVLLAITNIKSRQAEYDADLFVKEVGQAKYLQNALSLLVYNKEFKGVEQSFFLNLLTNIYDIFSIFLIPHSHPPTSKRLQALNESIELPDFSNLITILNPLDNLIKMNEGLLCKF